MPVLSIIACGMQRKLKSLGCLPAILKPLYGFNFIKKILTKLENQHKPKVSVVANMLKRGLHADVEKVRVEFYKKIMEMSQFSDRILVSSESDTKFLKLYGRVAKINTGLSYELDFDKNVKDFAPFFNLQIVELQGSKKIAEQSYQNAKKFP